MSHYKSNVRDQVFNLFEVLGVDKAFGAVNKAKNADTVVFTLSRFEEYPDLWTSDTTFKDMKKVSNLGTQVAQFTWGKSELIEYINADGKKLRAILTKPENFRWASPSPTLSHRRKPRRNMTIPSTPPIIDNVRSRVVVRDSFRDDVVEAMQIPLQ